MKKGNIFYLFIVVLFFSICNLSSIVYAKNIDCVKKYEYEIKKQERLRLAYKLAIASGWIIDVTGTVGGGAMAVCSTVATSILLAPIITPAGSVFAGLGSGAVISGTTAVFAVSNLLILQKLMKKKQDVDANISSLRDARDFLVKMRDGKIRDEYLNKKIKENVGDKFYVTDNNKQRLLPLVKEIISNKNTSLAFCNNVFFDMDDILSSAREDAVKRLIEKDAIAKISRVLYDQVEKKQNVDVWY
ncbi:MAG: hypothetical protein HQK49_05770 [Oligoflexia bacterium]|nr:hypothetical protein [Oligoflexia bacterium]